MKTLNVSEMRGLYEMACEKPPGWKTECRFRGTLQTEKIALLREKNVLSTSSAIISGQNVPPE